MKKSLPFLLLLFSFFPDRGLYAQIAAETEIQKSVATEAASYYKAAGNQALIFYGKDQPETGSKYLCRKGQKVQENVLGGGENSKGSFAQGELLYDRTTFTPALLRLDLGEDILALSTSDGKCLVGLDPEKVGYADFLGYRIIYVKPGQFKQSDVQETLPAGYYALLYAGDYSVLRKEIFARGSNGLFVNHWLRYYICKNGVAYRVKNKATVFEILDPGLKKELTRYSREAGLDFKRNMEDALVGIVKGYENLIKKQ